MDPLDPTSDQNRASKAPGFQLTGSATHANAEDAFLGTLSKADKDWLLRLARYTVLHAAGLGPPPEVPDISIPPAVKQPRGCFVTLVKGGELRGCVGHVFAQGPLYRSVIESARAAALRDPRFPPLCGREAHDVRIEISMLTEPRLLIHSTPEEVLEQIDPAKDGVVVRLEGKTATFLPKVWEQFTSKADFMSRLCRKAGCDSLAWRRSDAAVMIYQAESFEEEHPEPSGNS